MKKFKTIGMLLLFSISLSGVCLEKALAQNWGPGHSSQLQWYEMGGDPTVSHGSENAGFIRSKVSEPGNSGVYMTIISANSHKGKRVKLSAHLKTENVSSWAALWMRVDGYVNQKYQTLSFDNMQNRPIIGSNDWEKYEIVLDVPTNSTGMFYGILLVGTGNAWLDGLQLEVVGNDHYYAGKISEDSLFNAAENVDQQIEKERKCEAYYYAGMKHLFDGDTTKAKARFEACIATGITYFYEYEYAETELERLSQPTGVKEIVNTSIEDFELLQNYPNPFNPTTTISYSTPQPGFVELKIYDALGREIQTLVNEFQQAGRYSFDFDASRLSNGVYFYQLKVGSRYSETKKMLYMK